MDKENTTVETVLGMRMHSQNGKMTDFLLVSPDHHRIKNLIK